jgi:succinoglycan biosynthesis transport protein ExoP
MKSYAPPKLRQIVTEAVFRRGRIFLLTVFVVMAIVLLVTVLMPRKYKADAKLMVQPVRSQAPLGSSPNQQVMTNGDVSTTEINNEVDLLQSTGVARRALGESGSGTDTAGQERAVTQLQKSLDVEPVHQSSNIDVSLLADSPEQARSQLQKVLDAYFQERQNSSRSGGAALFFDEQAKQKAKQVDIDQQALTDFEVKHQIADLDEEKKLQVTRVGSLQDQLSAAEASLASATSRVGAQRRELATTPQRTATSVRIITNQYSQEHLNTEMVDLQNHRTELLKRYPPTSREVIEANEKIANIQRAIAASGTSPAGESATDVNPTYQQLNSALALSISEASGIAAQRDQLQVQLKDARQRLSDLEESTAPYDDLQRKLTQSQQDYTLYAARRGEASVSEALDNAKMFDVSLVQPPVSSPDAVRPKPVLYLAAGLAFALLLGTVLALYSDTSAEQVYTPAQLDTLTGERTIATFADEDDADDHEERNRLEYRRVLAVIRSALGAEEQGSGSSTAPSATTPIEGATVIRSGHDEAVASAHGKPAGYCVAFTSALAGEGVTFLLTRLATEAARQASSRVAVLDMGLLLRRFESQESVSFGMKFNASAHYWTLAFNGDSTLPSGIRQGGTQGQFSARLRPLLIAARREFDFIFLDCPSVQASTLASELDICVDGYVAVVNAAQPRKQNLEQLGAVLREAHAPLLGYVLNRRRYPVPGWLHRIIW